MSYIIFEKNKLAQTILNIVNEARQKVGSHISYGATLTFEGQTYQTNFGYFVSNASPSLVVKPDDLHLERLIAFLNAAEKQGLSKNHFIGIWFEPITKKLFFDISQHITNKKEAKRTGYLNLQIAIWDCKNDKEITL